MYLIQPYAILMNITTKTLQQRVAMDTSNIPLNFRRKMNHLEGTIILMIEELKRLSNLAELSRQPYLKAMIMKTQAKLKIDLQHSINIASIDD